MKFTFTDFPRKCQLPLLLASGTMPITMLLMLYGAPESLGIAWLFPAIYVLAALACLIISGKARVWCGLGAAALLLVLGIGVAAVNGGYGAPVVAVIYCAMLLAGLQVSVWSWREEVPPLFFLIGIALHVIVQLMVLVDDFYHADRCEIHKS